MSEMLGPLNKGQKELMGTLLESVKTAQLKQSYKKYLPSVLSEEADVKAQVTKKANLTETRKHEVNGDKVNKSAQPDVGGSADIIELKKLAGLS